MNKKETEILKRIDGLINLSSSIGGKEWNVYLHETNSEEYLPSDVLDYYEDDKNDIPIQKKELEKQKLELMDLIKSYGDDFYEIGHLRQQIEDLEIQHGYRRDWDGKEVIKKLELEEEIEKIMN